MDEVLMEAEERDPLTGYTYFKFHPYAFRERSRAGMIIEGEGEFTLRWVPSLNFVELACPTDWQRLHRSFTHTGAFCSNCRREFPDFQDTLTAIADKCRPQAQSWITNWRSINPLVSVLMAEEFLDFLDEMLSVAGALS